MLHSRSLLFISFVYSSVNVREGNGNPLQYSRLENPIDGGAWWAAVHGVSKSQTRLRDFTFTFHFHALEKEMATHSSVLAWRIPGTGEPVGLPSMRLHRVRHDWSDLAAAAADRGLCFELNWTELNWIFSRDLFSLLYLFSTWLISTLLSFYCFVLFTLISSSFTSSLRWKLRSLLLNLLSFLDISV